MEKPTVTTEHFQPEWMLERRIAHEGYPLCEARFGSVAEYIEHLEAQPCHKLWPHKCYCFDNYNEGGG